MPIQKGLFGNEYIVEDKAISIPIERYDELIKKESFYDKLATKYDMSVELQPRLLCEGADE